MESDLSRSFEDASDEPRLAARRLGGGQTDRFQPLRSLGFSRSSALWVALLLYAVLETVAAFAQRDQINTDAVAYLRHALYLSEGKFLESVSGYWSPLFIWSLAPLLHLGIDGLHACRLVLALWGMVLIVASHFFIRRFSKLRYPWDMIVLSLIALNTVKWAARVTSPDVILAAILIAYCVLSISPQLLSRLDFQIAAGMLGGAAYLAKSYGLPFFLAHFTFVMALRGWMTRGDGGWRHAARGWRNGLIAFLIVAGPWIGMLSYKYDKLTISTVGRVAHTIVGPPDFPRGHPNGELRMPPPGRITIWEVPETLSYNHWSPFQNREYFRHQIRAIVTNAKKIIRSYNSFDALQFFPAVLVLIPFVLIIEQRRRAWFPMIWMLGTFTLYSGGFLPIYFASRYLVPFLWPIGVVFFFDFLLLKIQRLPASHRLLPVRAAAWALIVLCLLSFSLPKFLEVRELLAHPSRDTWRRTAQELTQLDCEGPIAACPGFRFEATYISYHLSKPFIGLPNGSTVADVERMLEAHGAQIFLVGNSDWDLAESFLSQTKWILKATLVASNAKVLVFKNPNA